MCDLAAFTSSASALTAGKEVELSRLSGCRTVEAKRVSDPRSAPGGAIVGDREGSGKLDWARSRLYRGQILQENMRLKAFADIYTMHSFAQLLKSYFFLKIAKFR